MHRLGSWFENDFDVVDGERDVGPIMEIFPNSLGDINETAADAS
jgi:hypothetical protein